MRSLVFVYGTLRRGQANHHLMQQAHYCGEHLTPPRYSMVHLGAYPGLVGGGHTSVIGEVYEVNAAQLARLDQLEDYPRMYDRVLIPTQWGRAWVYLYRLSSGQRRRIASGDWSQYVAGQLSRGRQLFPDGSAA